MKSTKNHIPALVGLISPIICLLIFGQDGFIIPAMILILVILTIFRGKLEGGWKNDFNSCTNFDNGCYDGCGNCFDQGNTFILFPSNKRLHLCIISRKSTSYSVIGLLVIYCLKGFIDNLTAYLKPSLLYVFLFYIFEE